MGHHWYSPTNSFTFAKIGKSASVPSNTALRCINPNNGPVSVNTLANAAHILTGVGRPAAIGAAASVLRASEAVATIAPDSVPRVVGASATIMPDSVLRGVGAYATIAPESVLRSASAFETSKPESVLRSASAFETVLRSVDAAMMRLNTITNCCEKWLQDSNV